MEAFSFLMPSDWKFEGGMKWILDNPAMPSVTAFRVYNPAGREEFEVFPNQCYFWTNNQQLLNMFPPGSRYFGSEVRQPVPAQAALRSIIMPGNRSGYKNLKIVKEENLPELPLALGTGKQSQGAVTQNATGAMMRISYLKEGVLLDEVFYSVVETVTFPVQSMYGTFYNTLWFIDYVFSFKSESGKLESNAKVFQTITSSFRVNPGWYAKYNNLIEYLARQQITRINNVGEFSRMLSTMSDEMREDKLQQFRSSGDVYDRVSEKFSDNTLGIDRYIDPDEGKEIALPAGYSHAWCNRNGEYIVSDDPGFNPNSKSGQHWELMKKK
jgi:hypothetical protein